MIWSDYNIFCLNGSLRDMAGLPRQVPMMNSWPLSTECSARVAAPNNHPAILMKYVKAQLTVLGRCPAQAGPTRSSIQGSHMLCHPWLGPWAPGVMELSFPTVLWHPQPLPTLGWSPWLSRYIPGCAQEGQSCPLWSCPCGRASAPGPPFLSSVVGSS